MKTSVGPRQLEEFRVWVVEMVLSAAGTRASQASYGDPAVDW